MIVVMVMVAIVVAIVTAAFPCLFQFMATPLCLLAMLSVFAYGLVKVVFRFFNLMATAVVVSVQGSGWQCAPCHEGCSQDQN